MAQDPATSALLAELGIGHPTLGEALAGLDRREALVPPVLPPGEFGLETVAELKRLLRSNPRLMLAAAPALLGQKPTVAKAARLLDQAETALRKPEATLQTVRANRESAPFELPPEHRFEGYDTDEIPILPELTKFEEVADAAAWALTAIEAWVFRLTHRKAPFVSHTSSDTQFVYPLAESKGTATIALFSDWGTGYYHSQYIAKHIGRLAPGQAIHLGDVYYTGRQQDFAERFIPFLDRYVTSAIPLYTLNANHEMDTEGLAYFAYLHERRRRGFAGETVRHPQEGSYFCLTSPHYQVIGIDTAYEKNGRLPDGEQKNWLEARLTDGRSAGRVNILLSQNEPYEKEVQKLLSDDLATVAGNGLIDLWFWGDQHYCALYPPTPDVRFGGSCVGHGGYPYRLKDETDFASHLVPPLFAELEPRFPRELDLRPGLGNNGFCMLHLEPANLRIQYIDWRNREQFPMNLPVQSGQLQWP